MFGKRVRFIIVTVFFVVTGSIALYRWWHFEGYTPLPDTAAIDVQFPDGWEVIRPRPNLLTAFSPVDGSNDRTRENITIGIERLTEPMNPASYLQMHIDAAAERFEESQVGPVREAVLAGLPAAEVELSYTFIVPPPPVPPDQVPTEYKRQSQRMRAWVTVTIDEKQQGYAISCTAADATFEDNRETFQAVIDSFRLTEPAPQDDS